MLTEGGDPVLIDFGSTAPARVTLPTRSDVLALQDYASVTSSPPYRAPELWDPPTGGEVTEKTDGECEACAGALFTSHVHCVASKTRVCLVQ